MKSTNQFTVGLIILIGLSGCARTNGKNTNQKRIEEIQNISLIDGVDSLICNNITGWSKIVIDSLTFNSLDVQGVMIQQCLSKKGTELDVVKFGRTVFVHDLKTACLRISAEPNNEPPRITIQFGGCNNGFSGIQVKQYGLKKKTNRFEIGSLIFDEYYQ